MPKNGNDSAMTVRRRHNTFPTWRGLLLSLVVVAALSSCGDKENMRAVDLLNEQSYRYHYRDLDSTLLYAALAEERSDGYGDGLAEALNNKAFVQTMRMQYDEAEATLRAAMRATDSQIEQLVADVQMMRLCQRRSQNKDFYLYMQSAGMRLNRITEEYEMLEPHRQSRADYGSSEYYIVASTYFYYVGATDASVACIDAIDPIGPIAGDTAQLVNYLYNIGSGGIIDNGEPSITAQTEFDYLMRSYALALQAGYTFWQANALQAISEHLLDADTKQQLIDDNPQEIGYINSDRMPDTLLAGNLAQRALALFADYGDVYQTAGAYRTLGQCFFDIGDYTSALVCYENALTTDTAVNKAPDLVASIREQMSLAYSAIDDKVSSDANRNLYLDVHEYTRQDRQLEARIEQLHRSSRLLNVMLFFVILTLLVVTALIITFDRLRRNNERRYSVAELLAPLARWEKDNEQSVAQDEKKREEIEEQTATARQQLVDNKAKNLEQRAKLSLLNNMMPLINRIIYNVARLRSGGEDAALREERYIYVAELADMIIDYNAVLTDWIQMRQGDLNIHVESFALQELFDTVTKSRGEFAARGITLTVCPTDDVVKADRTLTLFMINTIAENARKWTARGGKVTIESTEGDDYVEISVADTGAGMSEDKLRTIFTRHLSPADDRPHGFGLLNCKGIIEKYRKTSTIFNVCMIDAESKEGEGSRFFFRLPKGVRRAMLALVLAIGVGSAPAQTQSDDYYLQHAAVCSDSAFSSNVKGDYARTMVWADSCCIYLNIHYLKQRPDGMTLMQMTRHRSEPPAEIAWWQDDIDTDYDVILSMRNEAAVAALALHDWTAYEYNNAIYTQLFRMCSADDTLDEYVEQMQRADSDKKVAVTILVALLLALLPAYYFLYLRHRIFRNLCVRKIQQINGILLSDDTAQARLERINRAYTSSATIRRRLPAFDNIVSTICDALRKEIARKEERLDDIELAVDELHRVTMERDDVYVSNSVLDNCLSTLKHETMYYPSRIRYLVDERDAGLDTVAELAEYYKELFEMLCAQAMRQVSTPSYLDRDTLKSLFYNLRALNAGDDPAYTPSRTDRQYVTVTARMTALPLTPKQAEQLFTPYTGDVRSLLCKQAVREAGEQTGARGCGIRAYVADNGTTTIEITLTQAIWNILKSLS